MNNACSEEKNPSAHSMPAGSDQPANLATHSQPNPLRTLKARALVKCWSTAARPDGESLTLHDIEILAARWHELFGEIPSTMPGTLPSTAKGPRRRGASRSARRCELLRKKDVALRMGISVRNLNRLVETGRFPKPLRIGKRTVGWPQSQVDLLLGRPDLLAA